MDGPDWFAQCADRHGAAARDGAVRQERHDRDAGPASTMLTIVSVLVVSSEAAWRTYQRRRMAEEYRDDQW